MALWVCSECTTRYAVGAPRCPHCGSETYEEDGMPKITRHGGPSIAGVTGGWSDNDTPDTWPAQEADEAESTDGGEQPSAGTSSETSPEKPSSEPETKPAGRRKPARTTGSRSTKARTGGSSAPSTGGEKTGPTSAPDAT